MSIPKLTSTSPTPPPASRAGMACPFGALKTVVVVASILVTTVTAVAISTVTSMMPPTPSSVVMTSDDDGFCSNDADSDSYEYVDQFDRYY